jgi:hypothetical protein
MNTTLESPVTEHVGPHKADVSALLPGLLEGVTSGNTSEVGKRLKQHCVDRGLTADESARLTEEVLVELMRYYGVLDLKRSREYFGAWLK